MARLKKKEADFVTQINTMITNMNAGILTPSGITPAQWDAVETALPLFVSAINNAVVARTASKAATAEKDAQAALLRSLLQGFVDKFYSTPAITNLQLESIGLPPRDTTTRPSLPKPVTNLTGKINPDGSVRLAWRRSGNTKTTMFELQADTGSGFVTITTSLGVRYTDGLTPIGIPRTYRIVAVNALGRALPSTALTVYGEGDSERIQLAA